MAVDRILESPRCSEVCDVMETMKEGLRIQSFEVGIDANGLSNITLEVAELRIDPTVCAPMNCRDV
jgi:hypothetical protein